MFLCSLIEWFHCCYCSDSLMCRWWTWTTARLDMEMDRDKDKDMGMVAAEWTNRPNAKSELESESDSTPLRSVSVECNGYMRYARTYYPFQYGKASINWLMWRGENEAKPRHTLLGNELQLLVWLLFGSYLIKSHFFLFNLLSSY